MSESKNFTVVTNNTFLKRPIEDILEDSKTINPKQIALEVIGWAIENVENYVDNTVKIFKLDLVLDAEETMQETKKLQDLYRSVPNDEDLVSPEILQQLKDDEKNGKPLIMDKKTEDILNSGQKCRETLDEIVAAAHKEMNKLDKYVNKLSERLVYYYEMRGIKDGVPLIQDLDGAAEIIKFQYDSFNVGVRIKKNMIQDENENKDILSEYVIPEGFTVWIEISTKDKLPQSLF